MKLTSITGNIKELLHPNYNGFCYQFLFHINYRILTDLDLIFINYPFTRSIDLTLHEIT